MAREVLSNGVIVPEKYTRDWFDDFRTNLVKLNDAITAIAGKQNALTQEQLDAVNSAITSQKVTAYDDHIADTSKHLTDGTAAKAIADEDGTSIKTGYVNVAGNQTVTGNKEFTGSNTFNNILPNANNTYSLGSSSYQWSSVYAQSYFYNGTAWGLDKANVWTGSNTFQTTDVYYSDVEPRYVFKSLGLERGVQPSWHGTATCYWYDKNSAELGFTRFVLYNNSTQTYEIGLQNKATNGDLSPTGSTISTSFKLELFKTGDSQLTVGANALAPAITNSHDLGTSTNKWKTLNGINPGALSLPSSNYIDISGDMSIRDGSASNSLTALCDGWIAICTFATWLQMSNDTLVMAVTGAIGTDGFSQAFLPVRKGDSIRIILNQTNTLFQSFKLIPCLGNV